MEVAPLPRMLTSEEREVIRELIPPDHVSMIYGIAKQTLKDMRDGRSPNEGPPYYNMGHGRFLYRRSEVEAWLQTFRVERSGIALVEMAELEVSASLEVATT
jgi:hypothetical protein